MEQPQTQPQAQPQLQPQPQPHPHHETIAGDHVLKTPTWVFALRVLQIIISFVILVMAGVLIHDAYLDQEGFALAMGLITCIVVSYIVLTEKISSLNQAYNVLAVLLIDGLMMILWLSAFAAVAAERAAYVYHVDVNGCFNDGSNINSETCFVKRGVILFRTGLALLAAIAGLGALVWLLFIATFVWTVLMFLRGHKQGRFAFKMSSSSNTNNNYQMEPKVEQQQPLAMAQPQQQQQQQYPVQPQPQGQYQQQPYQQPQSPYQQNGAYPPPDQQAYGQYPQQPIQPQMTGQGSELAGTETQPPMHHGSPPPMAGSPPPQQHYQYPQEGQGHHQPYPQQPTA